MIVIDVVLPCLDEAPALAAVLAGLPPGYRAIVADNGSTDGSARIAREHGARVIDVPHRGYGEAATAGLLAADSDVVCFADADGTCDLRQLPRLARPVLEGSADLVMGRRRPLTRAALPLHARAGNAVLVQILAHRTGLRLRDIGPARAVRRDRLLELELADRRFGYPLELLVRAAVSGWCVLEVDVDYAPRAAGTRSKVTGSVRGTMRTIRDMRAVLSQ